MSVWYAPRFPAVEIGLGLLVGALGGRQELSDLRREGDPAEELPGVVETGADTCGRVRRPRVLADRGRLLPVDRDDVLQLRDRVPGDAT